MADLPFVDVPAGGPTQAAVIWLHGLGDSGHGFSPIVPDLRLPAGHGIRFLFPHAPQQPVTINGGMAMRAWYDIKTLDFNGVDGSREDEAGLRQSAAAVQQLLDKVIASGVPSERIVLAGFSQGGVVAMHLLPRLPYKLAGVMVLSSYMVAAHTLKTEMNSVNKSTPVLVAHGLIDEVVPVDAGKAAFNSLKYAGFQVKWFEYRMGHAVCPQEVDDLSRFIQSQLLKKPD